MNNQKNILETIMNYSLELTYLLKKKKIKKDILYEAISTRNQELILKSILPVSKKCLNNLKKQYTKLDCFNEILYLTDNRYFHLKRIRDLVDITDIIEKTITDDIYHQKLNIHYADLLLDQLVETFYDYDSIRVLSKFKKKLIEKDSNMNQKIMRNIDRYYIRKITI